MGFTSGTSMRTPSKKRKILRPETQPDLARSWTPKAFRATGEVDQTLVDANVNHQCRIFFVTHGRNFTVWTISEYPK